MTFPIAEHHHLYTAFRMLYLSTYPSQTNDNIKKQDSSLLLNFFLPTIVNDRKIFSTKLLKKPISFLTRYTKKGNRDISFGKEN